MVSGLLYNVWFSFIGKAVERSCCVHHRKLLAFHHGLESSGGGWHIFCYYQQLACVAEPLKSKKKEGDSEADFNNV